MRNFGKAIFDLKYYTDNPWPIIKIKIIIRRVRCAVAIQSVFDHLGVIRTGGVFTGGRRGPVILDLLQNKKKKK